MLTLSSLAVSTSTILVLLAFVAALSGLVGRRRSATTRHTAGVPALVLASAGGPGQQAPAGVLDEPGSTDATLPSRPTTGWYAAALAHLALAVLTVGLVTRAVAVGHGPFANQHEFAVSFAWGLLLALAWTRWRHQADGLAVAVLPLALGMLLYAATVSATPNPLVPALQHNLLLTVHVLAAVIAYGAAGVACAAAVLSLGRPVLVRLGWVGAPAPARLDELGYRAVAVAFPLMTVMLILGSVWAERAWGTYWSWDPKETAALLTWLVYGGYLHARVVRGWRGRRAAWLLVAGFVAVLFTYFGNLFLGGMHSYA